MAVASVIQHVPIAVYQDKNMLVRHDGTSTEVATTLGEVLDPPVLDRKVTPTAVTK